MTNTFHMDDMQHNDANTGGQCICWRRKSTSAQLAIILIPMILLLAGFITMTVLFALERQKTTTITTTPSNVTYCETSDCVAAAGNMILALDKTVDPCDDFYQYSCGGFQTMHSGQVGQPFLIWRNVQKQLRSVLEAPVPATETEARAKVRKFYLSCLDRAMINAKSVPQMLQLINTMGGLFLTKSDTIPPDWSLDALLANRNKFSLSSFFSLQFRVDDKNVSVNSVQIAQGGLGIGPATRDYYLNNGNVAEAYTTLLTTYAKLVLGENKVDRELVKEVVQFERRLAEIQQPQQELLDGSFYNKVSVNWLQENVPFIQWKDFFNSFFREAGLTIDGDQTILLYAKPYITNLTNVIAEYQKTSEGKRTLQNYVVLMAVSDYGSKLSDVFQAAFNKFQDAYIGGRSANEIWETCLFETNLAIGFALGGVYVDNFFREDVKKRATSLINEIISSFNRRVTSASWMDEATKKEALDKLAHLQYDVGFPGWLSDEAYINEMYASLTVTDDYVANRFAIYRYELLQNAKSIHSPPDHTRWRPMVTPTTIDAYYEATQNKFVIPAGTLNPVFFYKEDGVPDLINFAAIGTTVAHEITHGFDTLGGLYDKFGNLKNWWSNDTIEEFKKLGQCFVDQYESYPGPKFRKYALDDLHIRGQQTLGENIADNGGIRTSYQAFKAAKAAGKLNVDKLVGLTNMSPDQLFFVAFAQSWCGVFSPEYIRMLILGDVHSPPMFRIIGSLINSPDFSAAFNCKPGTNMNPDPNKRCEMW